MLLAACMSRPNPDLFANEKVLLDVDLLTVPGISIPETTLASTVHLSLVKTEFRREHRKTDHNSFVKGISASLSESGLQASNGENARFDLDVEMKDFHISLVDEVQVANAIIRYRITDRSGILPVFEREIKTNAQQRFKLDAAPGVIRSELNDRAVSYVVVNAVVDVVIFGLPPVKHLGEPYLYEVPVRFRDLQQKARASKPILANAVIAENFRRFIENSSEAFATK